MVEISTQCIKDLREKTGAGIMECKAALAKSSGNMKMAEAIIRQNAILGASKKANRATREGIVETYIHTGGKIGVMLELLCETSFVAKTEDFRNLAKELAMQIAALNAAYASKNDVPEEVVREQKELYKSEAKGEGKKEEIIDRIVDGKMNKYYEAVCLIDQQYIRDDTKKVGDLIKEVVGKLGENIAVGRFVRYRVGE